MNHKSAMAIALTCVSLMGCANDDQRPNQTISASVSSDGRTIYSVNGSAPAPSVKKQTVAESYQYIAQGMRPKCPNGIDIKKLDEKTSPDKGLLSWQATVECKH